jgi:hypothetical protein
MPSAPPKRDPHRRANARVDPWNAAEIKAAEKSTSLSTFPAPSKRKAPDPAAIVARAIKPPVELEPVVAALGIAAALALLEAKGGTRFYIPIKPAFGSPLVEIVGLGPAERLAEAFGSEHLSVPIARAWRTRIYRVRGESVPAIAARLGITERAVGRILTDAGLTGHVWRYIQRSKDAVAEMLEKSTPPTDKEPTA